MKVTYEYYQKSYYGEVVPENDFAKWIKKAEIKLKYLTFDNMDETSEKKYKRQIQDSLCALADCMYLVEAERKRASEVLSEKNIKSMSSGGESISYETQKTIYQSVLENKVAENKLYRNTIAEYLHGTGLLYAGV